MIRCEKEGVAWLQFELLAEFKELRHAVFLRQGGASTGPFASLNTSYTVEDESEAVDRNLKRIARSLQVEDLIGANQVHGDQVQEVGSAYSSRPEVCDGLMSCERHVGLMIRHADCQAAIFYDPVNRAIANVHCGWRGSVKNIYRKTVAAMRQRYGSSPENLYVAVSPSLGPERAEFVNFREELPETFWEFRRKPAHFDFWEISRFQLRECGVLPQHMQIAELCTFNHPSDYFSYRRDGLTGRNATVVSLS